MTLKIELTRFRLKPEKIERAKEWMEYLRSNLPKVLETLEGEKMYVETIFHEARNGSEFLYWYSVQDGDGIDVSRSEHEIDKRHIEYWKECIDPEFKPEDLTAEVVMIPEKITRAMMS